LPGERQPDDGKTLSLKPRYKNKITPFDTVANGVIEILLHERLAVEQKSLSLCCYVSLLFWCFGVLVFLIYNNEDLTPRPPVKFCRESINVGVAEECSRETNTQACAREIWRDSSSPATITPHF
jgi:hypothetical protein